MKGLDRYLTTPPDDDDGFEEFENKVLQYLPEQFFKDNEELLTNSKKCSDLMMKLFNAEFNNTYSVAKMIEESANRLQRIFSLYKLNKMANFKIKQKTTKEIDIEISLPCYRKSLRGDIIYKIINDKEAIKVHNYGNGIRHTVNDGIVFCSAYLALNEDDLPATKEEFEQKYAETLVILAQASL